MLGKGYGMREMREWQRKRWRQRNREWQREREMVPSELQAVLDKHALRHQDLASYLDITECTLRRYLRGTAVIPVPIVLLLRALEAMQVEPDVP